MADFFFLNQKLVGKAAEDGGGRRDKGKRVLFTLNLGAVSETDKNHGPRGIDILMGNTGSNREEIMEVIAADAFHGGQGMLHCRSVTYTVS